MRIVQIRQKFRFCQKSKIPGSKKVPVAIGSKKRAKLKELNKSMTIFIGQVIKDLI
jgi:hypothetical protein